MNEQDALAKAREDLARARQQALEAPDGDLALWAERVATLNASVEQAQRDLLEAQGRERAKADALADLAQERERRKHAGEAQKLARDLDKAWDRWQGRWLELNAQALAHERELDGLKERQRELLDVASKGGLRDLFAFAPNADVRARRREGTDGGHPVRWPDRGWV
jgi:hypothetical protein